MDSFKLPNNFLLGSSTAALQIEGGDKNNNWYRWCETGHIKDKSSCIRADDHWNRLEEDIELLQKMNQKVYRMGIEWSRIEPQEGKFNDEAIEHYRKEIKMIKEKGIIPLVTLHHFTNPIWFEEKHAFESDECVVYFERYVRYVIEHIGDLVSEYITINEPNVYVTNGYFFGSWPPGQISFKLVLKVFRNMTLCHIKAFKAIHEIREQKGFRGVTMVGIAHHLRVFVPYSKKNLFDRIAAKMMDYMFQSAVLKSMAYGKFVFPIGIRAPLGRGKYYDFIGINYYTRTAVLFKGFKDDFIPNTERNDLDWEIYPEGLSILCKRFYKKYKAPIWITENGTCDNKDKFRSKYIYSHLYEVYKLINAGIPVERYYHWSFMDNFEWLEGESARFGLVHVDYETQKRTIKKSGEFYAEICSNNGITEDMIHKYLSGN